MKNEGAYPLFILVLSASVLVALAAEVVLPLDAGTRTILGVMDTVACVFFLLDFVRSLVRAPDKMRYLVTWGWVDLLSSIPALDALRLGRGARIYRVLRTLRAVRAARSVAEVLLVRRAQSAGLAAILLTLLAQTVGSIGALHLEAGHGGPIDTPSDALWWAAATITTVGYGDVYPVTDGGRLLGVALMAVGVCLVAAFTGLFAAWFLTPASRAEEMPEDA